MDLFKLFDLSKPVNHVYLMPYFYKSQLPHRGSVEFYNFLELLKYLESKGLFSRNNLCDLTEE